jgi:phosphatidylglycerol:prolipoprotein diacylglycerol transferase
MYPELFTIPVINYPISSFGVMMSLGFLAAYWITAKRLAEMKIDPDFAATLLIYTMLGGVLGSKLYYTIDVGLRTGQPFSDLFFARAGITWYGGLFGGIAAGALCAKLNKQNIRQIMNAAAVGCTIGQCFGRIGCFLVGDDYGVASDVPWAIAFPLGAPPTLEAVHPTQLYEVLWLLPVAAFLWSRRDRSPFLFGEYLAFNGFGRIFIEQLRVNPKVALGLTEPQWIGIALVLVGVATTLYFRTQARATT